MQVGGDEIYDTEGKKLHVSIGNSMVLRGI